MVGGAALAGMFVAIGIPFVLAGVLWLGARTLLGSDGTSARNVPDEPNRQGRAIPGGKN